MAGDEAEARRRAEDEASYKRAWLAIGLATMVALTSYTSLLVAIVASQSDTPDAAGPAFALGFALVPVAFVLLAFVSGHKRAPIAVLKAMGLWLPIALPLGLVNPVLGLCAAFGFGGSVALKHRYVDRWSARAWVVVLVSLYCFGAVLIFPPLGIISGGLLPFAVLGLADYYSQNTPGRPRSAG